jgi:tRNA-splicing ligase RtcB
MGVVGTDALVRLAREAPRLDITLPDRELACAPIASQEGHTYLGAMRAGINCALANRQILAHLTRQALSAVLPGGRALEALFDVSHNTCKAERHAVDGGEWLLYVHRKGATRAFGPGHPDLPEPYRPVGQPVIIGGSMGTGSCVLAGTRESASRPFSPASHGAGRSMSRHQALRRWQGRRLVDELAGRGILIPTRSLRGAAEEAPGASKDVDLVAEATEQVGLARRVALLRPKVCIKG